MNQTESLVQIDVTGHGVDKVRVFHERDGSSRLGFALLRQLLPTIEQLDSESRRGTPVADS